MKKGLLLLCAMAMALLAFGCSKSNQGTGQGASQPASSRSKVTVVNLWENAITRVDIDEAQKWGERVILGETFEYLGESRESTASDLRNQSFHRVRLHKAGGAFVDLWVYDWYTALNARPAVVIADTVAYRSDSLAAIEGTRIAAGVLIGAGTESSGFVESTWFEGESKKRGLWLERKHLSFNEIDIAAARSLHLLNAKDTKEDLKATLLDNALTNLKGSALYNHFIRIAEASAPVADTAQNTAPIDLRAGVAAVDIPVSILVLRDRVNVRSKPSIAGSQVLGVQNAGDRVFVLARTLDLETIDNATGYWYLASSEESNLGWIFGGYGEVVPYE